MLLAYLQNNIVKANVTTNALLQLKHKSNSAFLFS